MAETNTALPSISMSSVLNGHRESHDVTTAGIKSITDRPVFQNAGSKRRRRRRRSSVAKSDGDISDRRRQVTFISLPAKDGARTKRREKEQAIKALTDVSGDLDDDVFTHVSAVSPGAQVERQIPKRSSISVLANTDSSYSTPRCSFASDVEDDYGLLTYAELKKLRIIATLNKMGAPVKKTVTTRADSVLKNAEVSILEESRTKEKRGSISTRVLLAAKRRQQDMKRREERDRDMVDRAGSKLKSSEQQLLQDTWKMLKAKTGHGATEEVDGDREIETRNTSKRRIRRQKVIDG